MKKLFTTALLCASAVVGLAILSACGGSGGGMSSMMNTDAPKAYKTMKVEKGNRTIDSKYSATIRGRQDINVVPQVSGTLQELKVVEGQTVTKGQPMFVIDQVPYQAALNTAEANLEAAEAGLATAKLSYESVQKLYDQGVVSDFDLKTANNSYLQAKAAVAQAEAAVVNAKNSLGYTVVKSPANGVVGTLPYRVGTLVGPSMQQPLTTVSDNHQMYVYFSMTESALLTILRKAGSTKEALNNMPEVSLQLVDGSIYEQKGRVETISGVVDQTTGSVSMRAAFDNPNGLLHSGSTGNVVMPVEYKDVLVVPQAAVKHLQTLYQVFRVEGEDRIATAVSIEVAPYNNGKEYIVLSGLNVGDEIIADGAGMVKEGAKVAK